MPNNVINEIKKGTTVYDIQDKNAIVNPSSKTSGQILAYNGTAWVAQNAPSSGVSSVTAGNNSIAIGGSASAPTVAAKISAVTGNGLSVKSDGLYAQDTTYDAATTSTAGLMSAADKTKVNNLRRIFYGTSTPSGAIAGDFWFDG